MIFFSFRKCLPDFLIRMLTFFEVKSTGYRRIAKIDDLLALAYADLQFARLSQADPSYALLPKWVMIYELMITLDTWGGISAFDPKEKLLVVQWLYII